MSRINLLESLTDNIVIDRAKCVSCGVCVETCILDNLRLQLSPCRRACPLELNCQGYVQLIARGREAEALEMVRDKLPFPGILGRICSQPCERACHLGRLDGQPVAIKALKRYLAAGEKEPASPPSPAAGTGARVAVVGSGPAGLMAAHDLALAGHLVEVFEAEAAPGGMLRWAIPEFRLPLEVVEREIGLLEALGVRFTCGVAVGRERTLDQLQASFGAVIVAAGCPEPVRLEVEGRDLAGVQTGLDLLRAVRAGKTPDLGSRVVVIGGGNVALDLAETALRLGAPEVRLVCLESPGEMPALPGALEGALNLGLRLDCSWGPVRFLGREGRVSGVELRRCLSVFDHSGAFNPVFDPADLRTIQADTVLVAVGQRPGQEVYQGANLAGNQGPKVDGLTLQSRKEKVFIAGDCLTGPGTVVEAMASGRRAAESVDRFLRGEHLSYGRAYPGPVETDFPIEAGSAPPAPRVALPARAWRGPGDLEEAEADLDRAAARQEAERCLSCGLPFGKFRTCWFCLPCEVECPEEALRVEVPYLLS